MAPEYQCKIPPPPCYLPVTFTRDEERDVSCLVVCSISYMTVRDPGFPSGGESSLDGSSTEAERKARLADEASAGLTRSWSSEKSDLLDNIHLSFKLSSNIRYPPAPLSFTVCFRV